MIKFVICESGSNEDRSGYILIYPEVYSSKEEANQSLLNAKMTKYLFEFIQFVPEYQEKIQKVYFHPDFFQSFAEEIEKIFR